MNKPTFPLSDIYTASTASKEFEIPYSTIKDDLNRNHKFSDQIKRGLVKKEGRVWLITRQAIQEVYDK
ncbi:helix-turn-helix domain-containing protein [Oceanobacillus sp. FSL K6-2867]|uniref:helix-turn-helix domain-containing protein n=1 Tax=Oceanobacillus sp. FSL K6-2867 TaxID=2954748 RepID=UPI0030DCAB1B